VKRYPLQTLIKLREHRVEAARILVLDRQRAAQVCREACTTIEGEISGLVAEQAAQRRRLLEPPARGSAEGAAVGAWPQQLVQRDAHIELLGEQAQAARMRLAAAQETLRAAESAVADARAAFFRAKARQDALEKRRDVWNGEQRVIALQHEEAATDDLLQARHLAASRN